MARPEIEYVARTLTNCQQGNCGGCEFKSYRIDFSITDCQGMLISRMGEEVRRIAEVETEEEKALQQATQNK